MDEQYEIPGNEEPGQETYEIPGNDEPEVYEEPEEGQQTELYEIPEQEEQIETYEVPDQSPGTRNKTVTQFWNISSCYIRLGKQDI